MNDNILIMKHVSFAISLNCNLRCKLCGAYAPYYSNNKFPDIVIIKERLHNFFKLVDYVEWLSISGGEPLLYHKLPQVLSELQHYFNKIGKLEIVTNGTIVPSNDLLNTVVSFKKVNFYFFVDNYGKKISTKIDEISAKLKEFQIPFKVRDYYSENKHCGGWVDYSLLKEIIHTPSETAELFSRCAFPQKQHFCFSVVEDYLVACSPVYHRIKLGHKVDDGDYINLKDFSLSIEEQRKKIRNIYNTSFLETCAYCNGLCDDSERFTPAEQFALDELQQKKQYLFGEKNNE